MKKMMFTAVLFLFAAVPAYTDAPRVNLDFTDMTIAEFLKLVYRDTLGNDYVLEPEILQDERKISVRVFDFRQKENLVTLLKSLGYQLDSREGVDYISSLKKADDYDFFVYFPKYKRVQDLKSSLSPLLTGAFSGDNDRLIFKGSSVEISKLKKLLKSFDRRQKELVVRGKIYEVTMTKTDASSLSIVSDIFKNAGLALSPGKQLANFLSFKNSDVNAYFSALSTDDRFKLISEPSLRVRSNTTATITVGRDVPTLGNVTYNNNQAVQSVTYRSSGVIFEITPEIMDNVINLAVRQEMSNFSETVNGVNNSPTLVKREIKTNITAQSAELIVLGGLIEHKDTNSEAGLSFLPNWLGAKSDTKDRTEIILSLHVEVLPE